MTLVSEFSARVQETPEKLALITEKSQLTYDDLLQLVLLLDEELLARGLVPGEWVALEDRRAEFCLAMTFVASLRGLQLVFADASDMAAWGARPDRIVGGSGPSGIPRIEIDPAWFGRLGGRRLTGAGPGTAGYVHKTSGSTGIPKLCWLSEAEVVMTSLTSTTLGTDEARTSRLLSTLNAATKWSSSCNIGFLIHGGSVVSLSAHGDRFQQYVDLFRIDRLVTTPAMVAKLAELPRVGQYLASLRTVVLGGAIVGEAVLRQLSELTRAELRIAYGSTEAGSTFHHRYDPAVGLPGGMVGLQAQPGMHIAFFDEAGAMMPEASEGLLGFRNPGVPPRRYLGHASDAVGPGSFMDGWFVSTDIGRRAGDTYLIKGRVGNLINFGGNKVALEAVQDTLETAFPGATMVAFAVAGPDALERLVVVCRGPEEVAAPDMTAALAKRFHGLEVIRAIRVEAMPMTATGKIDREALRRCFLDR